MPRITLLSFQQVVQQQVNMAQMSTCYKLLNAQQQAATSFDELLEQEIKPNSQLMQSYRTANSL